ncbi:aldo/keto reductase [Asanoa iriomotensis]|uniref:Oxidoreductase n=1 Tax=Asanoa iriomotensis TaxID=234613 RepID=A0ABQ4BU87_9ACTN|nr:aldo/keto reductase [Asanoa iriomotensis]GIF54094.1 oxidoreductase [Asanoa iriomotensis]
MRYVDIGGSGLLGSTVALGCMRIASLDKAELVNLLGVAVDAGINLFDHADIYGGGRCEEVFGEAFRSVSVRREDVLLQTKCGIRDGFFDFSKEHILASVNGSLSRLGTDHVDLLLLHRPDALVEPAEVAAAFDELHAAGKVRAFGVSNQHPMQIELLRRHVRQPLVTNQLQLSVAHTGMIDAGINVNMTSPGAFDRDGGVLDYCRLHGITIQAWSVLQYGQIEGTLLDAEQFPELDRALRDTADQLSVTPAAVAVAWILRHPARMQAIVGSTNAARVASLAAASDVELSRPAWYEVYRAAGNRLP